MAFTDKDPLGSLKQHRTFGGHVFWDMNEKSGRFRLQKHKFAPLWRILDDRDCQQGIGEEGAMRALLRVLTAGNQHIIPKCGDIVGIHNVDPLHNGGLFDHYGIYADHNAVYHYRSVDQSDMWAEIVVQRTTFEEFLNGNKEFFIMEMCPSNVKPGKIELKYHPELLENEPSLPFDVYEKEPEHTTSTEYTLYSPEETVQRAHYRMKHHEQLNQTYWLHLNNCEHFAYWCKTGVQQSYQAGILNGFAQQWYDKGSR